MTQEATKISESAVRAARDLRVVVSRVRRKLKEISDARELTPSQTSVLSRPSGSARNQWPRRSPCSTSAA
jgi:hypothetical protein